MKLNIWANNVGKRGTKHMIGLDNDIAGAEFKGLNLD